MTFKIGFQISATIVLLGLILGCAGHPASRLENPEKINVEGTYVHLNTGMKFPETVNEFVRVGVTKFNSGASDVGVGFNSSSLPIIITVYVYPAPKVVSFMSPPDVVAFTKEEVFRQHFEHVKAEIIRTYPEARLIEEKDTSLVQGGQTYPGLSALYRYLWRGPGAEGNGLSRAYLLQNGDWLILYRITYPENDQDKASKQIDAFIQDLKLPPRI